MLKLLRNSLLMTAVSIGAYLAATDPSRAQDTQTLADIRQELSVLYVEVQRLKRELSTTGSPEIAVTGNSPLERIDSMESALVRLTSKTEELEYRVNQIATRGGLQVSDLEFRLCELESDCDIADLADVSTLGNVELPGGNALRPAPLQTGGAELAVGEKADFDQAKATLETGDYTGAEEQLAIFLDSYPGSPLSAEAYFLRGDALEKLDEIRPAARAYLDSFSSAPTGPVAADALFRVGSTLETLGKSDEACQMFAQVGVRFPDSDVAEEALNAQQNLGCL